MRCFGRFQTHCLKRRQTAKPFLSAVVLIGALLLIACSSAAAPSISQTSDPSASTLNTLPNTALPTETAFSSWPAAPTGPVSMFRGGTSRNGVYSGQGENLFAPLKGPLKWKFQTNGGLLSVPPAPIPGRNIGRREIPKDQERQVRSTPAVIYGAAYFGSDDGLIYAVDIKTGEEIWRFQTGGEVESSPAVAGGLVLVGSLSNTFFALDQKTGEPRWTFNTGSMVKSSSVVIDGAVLFGSWDNNFYAVELTSGNEFWRFELGNWVWSSPAVADQTVYFGNDDWNLYALDLVTGKEKWRFGTSG